MTGRTGTAAAFVARLGFEDTRRAVSLAAAPEMAGVVDIESDATGLLRELGGAADPDLGLFGVLRLLEAAGSDEELRSALVTGGEERRRLVSVLGASAGLTDHLVRHPDHWRAAARPEAMTAKERVADLVGQVTSRGADERGEDVLRVAYRRQMVSIAARDLSAENPADTFAVTAESLADLAGAALEAALALACEEHPEDAAACRLAVIAMGKTGGRELNYISDVDTVFVAEAADGIEESTAMAAAARLATALMRACSEATPEGALWEVDAGLRPEGRQGPLVRTVASHVQYYRRWAKTWEFQALLKARVVAGDIEVGQAYVDAVWPMVWEAASRPNFVEDVQAMRLRVESLLPRAEAAREIKLGVGGLRDIEFSAQLLQLVHGRTDPSLRTAGTLDALAALAAGGYIAREDAAHLDEAYRFLRSLEHRVQVHKMRRTHLMPIGQADLRRLGRAMGYHSDPATEVVDRWKQVGRGVRRLHESLFYRPLLAAVARLSSEEAHLRPEAAKDRLKALGYRDPAGALRHLEALTSGPSRTAAIQRTLMPVMLGWFADEADPDAGLLAFRQVSESLGGSHWYLKMLRDEGRAAERLAHVLARSRYAAELLAKAPDSARILGEDSGLQPRGREAVLATMRSTVARHEDPEEAMAAARSVRRLELFRIALADLVGAIDLARVGTALTAVNEALLEVALDVAVAKVSAERGAPVPADLALIGMGRLGGAEVGYMSDADLLAVHRPHPDADPQVVTASVNAVVQELRRSTRATGPDPSLEVDLDLRPEGKNGPLSRTVEGYRSYYERWSDVWEHQALLRARPVSGAVDLGQEFVTMADAVRYAQGAGDDAATKEIRRLKARMEAERLPRGADPKTHLKLGPGGLSDVEWTVQLIQLRHAHEVEGLRTTSTLDALAAARQASLIDGGDAQALREAWVLASSIRDAAVLWKGRGTDRLPTDARDAEAIHRILGEPPGSGARLDERYRRAARRARAVAERVFYGRD